MLKKISIPLFSAILMLPTLTMASSLDSLSTAFSTGTVSGQIGVNFRVNQYEDNSNDGNIGTAYLELDYLTNDYMGAKLGTHFLGVGELWSTKSYEQAFTDSGEFRDKAMLRDFYLDYTIPGSKSQLLLGRKRFKLSPVTDGDVHQGVQLTVGDIEKTTLYASVINRWVNNSSTAYDMDGIDATWLNGDDIALGASDYVYSLMAYIDIVPDMVILTPFFTHQNDVLTTYGSTVDFTMPIYDGLNGAFDGTFAIYDEDTAAAGDEDAYSYNLHWSLSSESWNIGLGYYMMSNDVRVDLTALGNYSFDPMEEAVYGAAQDDNTLYFDATYTYGRFFLAAVFGDTDVDQTAEGAKELDLYLTYAVSDAITAELMFVDVNDNDSALDYEVYAGTINLSF